MTQTPSLASPGSEVSEDAAPDVAPPEREPRAGPLLDAPSAGWLASALRIESEGRELHVGLEMRERSVELVAYTDGNAEPIVRAELRSLPTCEPADWGGPVDAQLQLESSPTSVGWTSSCKPRDGATMGTLEEAGCVLSFESESPARVLVVCDAYYEGGAHPDISRSAARFLLPGLIAVPACEFAEIFARYPDAERELDRALDAVGCPAAQYREELLCEGLLFRPDGSASLIARIYPPRVERMLDCDQLELTVELGG